MLLMVMMSGCCSIQKPSLDSLPDSLIQDCPVSVYQGETYGDVIEYSIYLKTDLKKCNKDKAALRTLKRDLGDE